VTAPRPRTAADIDAATDALAPTEPVPDPLPTAEVLAHLAYTVHGAAIDLWALRDSIEHHEPHTKHALAEPPPPRRPPRRRHRLDRRHRRHARPSAAHRTARPRRLLAFTNPPRPGIGQEFDSPRTLGTGQAARTAESGTCGPLSG